MQEGDQDAFRALVVASHARLTRVAQGVLRDPQGAEDAVQQAFLDIWRDIRRLRDPGRFEGWSYKLLLRICYAEVRRRPRWVPDSQIPAAAEPRAGDVFGVVVANTSHNDGEMMGAEVFSNLDDVRLDDELSARVRTPTLFLWGEDDGFGGVESGRRLAARLQDAELEAMPAAGHLSWLDDPASAARSVSAFLRRNRASGVEPTPKRRRRLRPGRGRPSLPRTRPSRGSWGRG